MTRLKEFNVTITYPYQSRPAKYVVVQGINFPDAEATARNLFGGNARCTGEHKPKKMKTFKEFNEAVSAVRLAQLAAKGKGAAAASKMAADGLKGAKTASTATSAAKKALPAAGSTAKKPGGGGGALVKSPQSRPGGSKAGSIVKSALKSGAEAAVQGALANRGGKSGALAKTGDTAAEKQQRQRDASGSAGEPPRDTTYRSGPKEKTLGDKIGDKFKQGARYAKRKAIDRAKEGIKSALKTKGKSASWTDGQDYGGADRAQPK